LLQKVHDGLTSKAMKRLLIPLCSLLFCHAFSQASFQNLEEYLQQVRENNPSLKAEKLNHRVQTERVNAAWSAMLPQIRAFAGFDNNISLPVQLVPAEFLGGPEGEFAEVQFGTRYNSNYGVEASLPLVNLANWRNVKASVFGEKAAEAMLKDKEMTLIEQAATTYFTILSREAVALGKELVSASDSLLKAAQVRLDNGSIEPMDFNRVKALYLESVQQLRSNKGAYDKNLHALKFLTGIKDADTIILTETISQAIEQRPTKLTVQYTSIPRVQALNYRRLQSQEELKRQRARLYPEVSLFARYSRQSFSNELDLFSAETPWYEVGVAGLRAEWSLFSGFNRRSAIRQASLQSQIAGYELDNYALQNEKELNELRINHEVSIDALMRYLEHYQLNKTNFNIAGIKYNEGVYSIDQYITIYQERVRSQNQYLSSLANFLVYEAIIRNKNLQQ
jgi:outer membrane protein TolC